MSELTGTNREVETLLRRLTPASATEPTAIWAEALRRATAAQQSTRRQLWAWRATTGAIAAALAIIVWPHQPPATQTVGPPVVKKDPAPAPLLDVPHQDDPPAYLILRDRVLAQGIGALDDDVRPRGSGPLHVYRASERSLSGAF